MRLLPLLTGMLLSACAGNGGPPTFVRSPQPLPGLVEQAAQFAVQSPDQRLRALTGLLDTLGLRYRIESFANPHPERDPRAIGHNVVVVVGDAHADGEIIVGAHYDAARLADGRYVDGIVDNAAGSVVLARLGATLKSLPLHHRVRLVFFDLEEAGLLGSAQFAATVDPTTITAMINLDVHGYGDSVLFGPSQHAGNDAVYSAMHLTCAAHRFDCMAFAQYPPSDDRSFQKVGIPNISVAVLPAVEAHQLWLMLNAEPHQRGFRDDFVPPVMATIHSERDTAARLDPAAMTLGHDVVLALLLTLDRRPD